MASAAIAPTTNSMNTATSRMMTPCSLFLPEMFLFPRLFTRIDLHLVVHRSASRQLRYRRVACARDQHLDHAVELPVIGIGHGHNCPDGPSAVMCPPAVDRDDQVVARIGGGTSSNGVSPRQAWRRGRRGRWKRRQARCARVREDSTSRE